MSVITISALLSPILVLILCGIFSKGGSGLIALLIPIILLTTKGGYGSSSSSMPAQEEPAMAYAEEENSIFSELPESFCFASGAGGWATTLTIYSDGYFEGNYADSEYSPDEDAMVVYDCSFYGYFGNVSQIDEYTYMFSMTSINYSYPPGEEWEENNTKHIATEAYGLAGANELYLYLPGHPTSDLSDACLSWIAMPQGYSVDELPDTLDCYVLYNINEELAFVGNK